MGLCAIEQRRQFRRSGSRRCLTDPLTRLLPLATAVISDPRFDQLPNRLPIRSKDVAAPQIRTFTLNDATTRTATAWRAPSPAEPYGR